MTKRKIAAVDLFSGIGALTLGVRRAGVRVALAVEADPVTAGTYRANNPRVEFLEETITSSWSLSRALRQHGVTMDLLVGGPPCRGWSTLGARSDDARKDTFQACTWDFARLVHETSPPGFLFENVNGLRHAKKGAVLERLIGELESGGKYLVSHRLLRSADYGVPQLRRRLFIVGVHRDLGSKYAFPDLTHDSDTWITVDDAIDDLPALAAGETTVAYDIEPRTAYQRALRLGATSLTWHEAPRAGDTVRRVLRALGPGQARADLEEGVRPSSGFHNTYGRMSGDAPASAVTGSIGRVSSGRYAHPRQNRALTPREAARLQSLPDSYKLTGFRWQVYRQIGDAVPPALAEVVAKPLVDILASQL